MEGARRTHSPALFDLITTTDPALGGADTISGGDGEDKILGGAECDTLHGGEGDDILLGGDGHDALNGWDGRDLLIWGLGADTLDGDDEEDILIGGTTSYDADESTLNAIRTLWLGSQDFLTLVANVSDLYLRAGVSVFDDGFSDSLRGDKGRDWFWADRDTRDGDDDALSDLTNSDRADLL